MRATPSTTEIHRIVFPQTSFSGPPSPSIPRWLLQECQDRKLCWSDCDKCLTKQLKRRRDFSEFTASAQFAWGRLAPLFLSLSKMLWQLKCVEDATHPTWPGSREWETGARYLQKNTHHDPLLPSSAFRSWHHLWSHLKFDSLKNAGLAWSSPSWVMISTSWEQILQHFCTLDRGDDAGDSRA